MEDEIIQQDANQPESSAPADSSPAPSQESSAPEQRTAEPQVPFHEHPRFKELIEERKQYAAQLEAQKAQMEEMRRHMDQFSRQKQEQPKEEHPLVAKMKEIDPRYAEYLQQLEARAGKTEDLEQRLARYENESTVQKYERSLEQLCTENKVPAEWKEFYDAQLRAAAVQNPKLGLNDLPQVFKGIHEKFSKLIEGTKRSERASYVTDKSKDSSAPATQPKGKVAAGKASGKPIMDKEELFASIARSAANRSKAGSEL